MTDLLTFNQEAEAVSRENGVYIPVHQLNQLARAASKATNSIVNSLPHGTYQEFDFVLELVRRSLEAGRNYKERS